MSFWSYHNLARVTEGEWLVEPADLNAQVAGLWHDTREIKPGQAYLAIKGDNFDGHDFVDQAFDAGASLAIVSDSNLKRVAGVELASPRNELRSTIGQSDRSGGSPSLHPGHPPVLLVQDTVKALQDLAHAYRGVLKEGGCKVIGIAGSNGKTTTRHLIHHVLTHAGLKGTQSPKSFNNHLGVPLTLLSGKPQDDFVACEIGTNHPGEIDFLSAIARPDIAVITSIGEEHLAFFKDLDGVIEEELSIGEHLPAGAYCIVDHSVPRDHPAIRDAVHRASRFAGGAGLLQHILNPNHTPSIRCSFLAAWTALSVGVRAEDIRLALRCVEAVSGRWERLSFNHDVLVINDAYNANPSSVKMAIGDLDRWDRNDGRKVVVLGDMHELGERAMDYHCEIGRFMLDFTNLNDLITIGPMAKQTFQSFVLDCGIKDDDRSFDAWSDDLPDKIADLLQPGDTVLLKASRGMRLERLIPAIERRFGQAPPDEPT